MTIETSGNAVTIHEITHIRQSLKKGGLFFNSRGELRNPGFENDSKANHEIIAAGNYEIEAYQAQYSLDFRSLPQSVGNIDNIDLFYVGNIMYDGIVGYKWLQDYLR